MAFQSAPPRGGRRERVRGLLYLLLFQSAPPRGGPSTVHRQPEKIERARPLPIAARSGQAMTARVFSGKVSIQTPPRGGRPDSRARSRSCASFNPRPRVGGDDTAPARWSCSPCFNPRPRVGGDQTIEADSMSASNPAHLALDTVSIRAPVVGSDVGRKPYEHSRKSCSYTASSTSRIAPWTILSSTADIPIRRVRPRPLGMCDPPQWLMSVLLRPHPPVQLYEIRLKLLRRSPLCVTPSTPTAASARSR